MTGTDQAYYPDSHPLSKSYNAMMQLKMNMILGVHKLKITFNCIFFISLSIQAEPIEGVIAEIQILDKITAKVKTLEVEVNNSIKFESLNIEIYACYKNHLKKYLKILFY